MKYYDKACEIYTLWHLNIKPHVKQEISALFELGIGEIKNDCQKRNYTEALTIVRVLINGFNKEDYKSKKWGPDASKIFEKLNDLEKELSNTG